MRTVKPEPAPHPTDSLPSGWAWGRIEDLVGANGVYIDGDWVESKDQDPNGDVRLIQLADVGDGFYVNKSNRFLTAAKAHELGCTFMQAGDVLIARMPDPLGRACIFPGDARQAVTVVDVCIVRCGSPDVDHQWLMNAINAPAFRTAIGFLQSGSTRARISRGNLSTLWLPVPPSKEQQRIVAALDERLSELDASVANLERAERNLVRYRASVLAAACSGKLVPTEADLARRAGRTYEPADQLLVRILDERRKANTKAKYEEPAQPDTGKLPKLPEGWVWAAFDQLFENLSDGGRKLPTKDYLTAGKHPVIDQGEKAIGGYTNDDALVFPGPLPVVLFGDHTRRFKLVRSPFVVGADGVKIIGLPEKLSPEYLYLALSQAQFEDRGYSRHYAFVRKCVFPVPPLPEQERIVAEVDRHLSRADALAASIAQAKRRAQRLRRSILAAAFRGRLVPQDPNDEPASVLLDRIRAQAAAAEQTAQPARRGRPSASTAPSTASDEAVMSPAPRRGRPPGSKNTTTAAPDAAAQPRRRGRPPGSKNRPKT